MSAPSDVREIRDENGDMLMRVWEANPGTVLRALHWQAGSETHELLDYPETWYKLPDRQLFKLCRSGPE